MLLSQHHELIDVLLRELSKLGAKLALLARGLHPELPQICAERANGLARRRLLARGGNAQLRGKVLCLRRALKARDAKLAALKRPLLRQLFGRKAQLARGLTACDSLLTGLKTELAALNCALLCELLRRQAQLRRLPGRRLLKPGPLQTQLARQLCGRQTGLRLLLQKLPRELLRRHAHLGGLCGKLPLKLVCRKPELARQLLTGKPKLPLLLRGLCGKLFCRKAKRTGLLSGLRQELVCRKPGLGLLLKKLAGKLFRRNAKLSGLPRQLPLKLRGRYPKLPGQLFRALTKLPSAKHAGLRQLLRRKPLLATGLESLLPQLPAAQKTRLHQLLRGQTRLRGELLRRQAQLPLLLRGLRRKLFGRKPQLPCRLRGRQTGLRALRAKAARKLCRLLRPGLLRFKRCLRPLCRGFEARRPHLRRRAALLFQDVALEFLLRNRLTRAAKRARANRLRPNALLRDLPLTRNVRQSLLNGRVFELVHERLRGPRIESTGGAPQTRNALLRGRCAKSARLLKRLRRPCRNAPGPLDCRRLLSRRLIGCAQTARPGCRRKIARRARNTTKPTKGLQICTNATSRRLIGRGPRCLCPGANSAGGLRRAEARAQPRGTRGFRATKTGRTKSLRAARSLRPRRVNRGLRAKARRLLRLQRTGARGTQRARRALYRAPRALDRGRRVLRRLRRQSLRALTSIERRLPGQAANAAQRRRETLRNSARPLDGASCAHPSLPRRLRRRLLAGKSRLLSLQRGGRKVALTSRRLLTRRLRCGIQPA